jgi:hypothetical protein
MKKGWNLEDYEDEDGKAPRVNFYFGGNIVGLKGELGSV